MPNYPFRAMWPNDWRDAWSFHRETHTVRHHSGIAVSFNDGNGVIVSGKFSDVIGLPHLLTQARDFFREHRVVH